MGLPAAGQVVVLQFPFSDLSGAKMRPAVLLADVGRGDWVVCQITSNPYGDSHAIPLTADTFSAGALARASYARPGKLFTANERLIQSTPAVLKRKVFFDIREALMALLRAS